MNLKDKVMFIGIGCYGGKQVKEFVENYGYKGIAVNGSEQDKSIGRYEQVPSEKF